MFFRFLFFFLISNNRYCLHIREVEPVTRVLSEMISGVREGNIEIIVIRGSQAAGEQSIPGDADITRGLGFEYCAGNIASGFNSYREWRVHVHVMHSHRLKEGFKLVSCGTLFIVSRCGLHNKTAGDGLDSFYDFYD